MYVCIYIYIYVCMYVCVCLSVCMYVCMHVSMYACMYIYIGIYEFTCKNYRSKSIRIVNMIRLVFLYKGGIVTNYLVFS